MCFQSFQQVGQCIAGMVGDHGGRFVISRAEMIEHLRRELPFVASGAIDHFTLCLRRHGLVSSPHDECDDGSVLIIYEKNGAVPKHVKNWHLTPGAKFRLKELAVATA